MQPDKAATIPELTLTLHQGSMGSLHLASKALGVRDEPQNKSTFASSWKARVLIWSRPQHNQNYEIKPAQQVHLTGTCTSQTVWPQDAVRTGGSSSCSPTTDVLVVTFQDHLFKMSTSNYRDRNWQSQRDAFCSALMFTLCSEFLQQTLKCSYQLMRILDAYNHDGTEAFPKLLHHPAYLCQ